MMNEQLTADNLNDAGHLQIGGVDALTLAHQFDTPLYVYDISKVRDQIHRFKHVFEQRHVRYGISYASKAFSSIGIYQVIAQEGIHTDVVSGGELQTAINAGFPMAKVAFHGNNKSREELEMAVKHGVGLIIVDNFHEIDLLNKVLQEQQAHCKVVIRITPGIAAHTNSYIATGQVDSKFGFDLQSGQADRALQIILQSERMEIVGVHAHVGSQVFDGRGVNAAARKLVDVAAHWKAQYGYEVSSINVGGGFGIQYSSLQSPMAPEDFVDGIITAMEDEVQKTGINMPAIWIEPGRSLVGPAGYTLYTVGSRKDIPGGYEPFISVDGGMGDNIRPALYQAEYETVYARDPQAPATERVRIAGKYCESGDVLAMHQPLPKTRPGDILAMLDTGAYGYAMASNYNRNPRPAVVFAEDGEARLVIRRETPADVSRLDLNYLAVKM